MMGNGPGKFGYGHRQSLRDRGDDLNERTVRGFEVSCMVSTLDGGCPVGFEILVPE